MNKKTIRTLNSYAKHHLVNSDDLPALQQVVENFSISMTDQMHQLIDKENPMDPIAKQFVPSVKELTTSLSEHIDPIGDSAYTTVNGIIHRYPDRCLFMPVQVCPVYCRFCFRKERIGGSSETLTPHQMDAAFTYINDHKEIWEVILTGGDPLILKPVVLQKIIERLVSIEHVEIIRIHTRVPVVDSQRMTSEMITALKCQKPVYVVLHANHPNEFSQEASIACAALVDAGIPMLSQTTLLKDINDNIDVLVKLMRCFIKNRIKPYYLHHADMAMGTQHFRTSIETGQTLMKQLRGHFSGICQPTYVLDIPGGFGKVPITSSYINKKSEEDCYCVEDYQGRAHRYGVEIWSSCHSEHSEESL